MDVFIVSAELSATSAPLRERGLAGAFVHCYVWAQDIRQAIDLAESALAHDDYNITCLESATIYESEAWDHAPEVQKECEQVQLDHETRYSDFSSFGH